MYVIARRGGEWIAIGDCRLTVVKIDRDAVRLGVDLLVDPTLSTLDNASMIDRGIPKADPGRGRLRSTSIHYLGLRSGETIEVGACRVTLLRAHAGLARIGVEAPGAAVVRGDRRNQGEQSLAN